MAAKQSLQKHFVEEPELSTVKSCFQSCVNFAGNHQLTTLLRPLLKVVCNLAKNPALVPLLVKKGFMETLIEMLH